VLRGSRRSEHRRDCKETSAHRLHARTLHAAGACISSRHRCATARDKVTRAVRARKLDGKHFFGGTLVG
jgi:hypothetical protein